MAGTMSSISQKASSGPQVLSSPGEAWHQSPRLDPELKKHAAKGHESLMGDRLASGGYLCGYEDTVRDGQGGWQLMEGAAGLAWTWQGLHESGPGAQSPGDQLLSLHTCCTAFQHEMTLSTCCMGRAQELRWSTLWIFGRNQGSPGKCNKVFHAE